MQPVWKVRTAMDHYQFLQVMRLISSSSRFVDQLTTDQKFFAKSITNGNGVAVNLIFFVEQVFFVLFSPMFIFIF